MTSSSAAPLSWSHATTDIPDGGLVRERQASEEECAATASALGLISLPALRAKYKIFRLAGGAYRLHGEIFADVVQACVVTVEPVPSRAHDTFDAEFWAELDETDDGREEIPILDGRDVEPLEHGTISVGRIVYETLAAALDPYPRKPDAEFSWRDDTVPDPARISPFAALSKLKDKT